MDQKSKQLAVS